MRIAEQIKDIEARFERQTENLKTRVEDLMYRVAELEAREPPTWTGRKAPMSDADLERGMRLRSRRLLAGWTQHDLAERVGVRDSMIGFYERGQCSIPAHRRAQISQAFLDAGHSPPQWEVEHVDD